MVSAACTDEFLFKFCEILCCMGICKHDADCVTCPLCGVLLRPRQPCLTLVPRTVPVLLINRVIRIFRHSSCVTDLLGFLFPLSFLGNSNSPSSCKQACQHPGITFSAHPRLHFMSLPSPSVFSHLCLVFQTSLKAT